MCGFGSEPKPGDNSPVTVSFKDIIDPGKLGRENLSYAGGGLIDGWDIGTFCGSSSEAFYQPVRGAADSLTRAFNAVVTEKWNARCKCKPAPDMFPVQGGQCDVFYDFVIIPSGNYYLPPHDPRVGTTAGARARGPLRFRFTREIDGGSPPSESIRCTGSDRFGADRATTTAAPYKPGTAKIVIQISRVDGLPDNCGNQSERAPFEPNLPPGFVFAPLDPESFCPPCSSPEPGILFIPTPVPIPVPPIIIPIPIPFPVPGPPAVCPPCVCPDPRPDPRPDPDPIPSPLPPKEPTVDCCPEILSRLTRLQTDVLGIREEDVPRLEKRVDDRFDGLYECLDFEQGKLGSEAALGSGETGTFVLPARAIAIRLVANTPTPANRSLRQTGGPTPDVIQGGWAWFRYKGGMDIRTPIDAESKLIHIPKEIRPLQPLTFVWRGVHQIGYDVTVITAPDRTSPPYEVRPCQE